MTTSLVLLTGAVLTVISTLIVAALGKAQGAAQDARDGGERG